MSQFDESFSVGVSDVNIEVASANFRVGSRGENILHDCGHGANGGIEEFTIFVAKEVEAHARLLALWATR